MTEMTNRRRNLVLFALCLVNLCLGSIYTFSVFSQAMIQYLSETMGLTISPGAMAMVYTTANCIGPVTMITGGRINDTLGPKLVILIGGILFGGGMFLSGFARGVAFMMVSFGIIGGLGLGMAYGSTISTSVKLFPEKSGLVGGITTACYGLSSVILPPIVSMLVARTNAPSAFRIVGLVFMVIIVLCALSLGSLNFASTNAGPARGSDADIPWNRMLRMPVFYVMLLLLICGAFSGMMIISQASSISINTMELDASKAALIVSILALFNTAGRIAAGFLSDKIGRVWTLRLASALSVVAELCLLLSGPGKGFFFYLGIALAGVSFGSFMGVYPGFTADQFGFRYNSVNYGIMCIGFALAGLFGPMIAGNSFSSTGSYRNAFLYAGIFSAAGLALTFLYAVMAKKEKNKAR